MKKFFIVDLDGTVCNIDHRKHFASARLWDDFHANCAHDKVIEDAKAVVNALSAQGYRPLIVTGRTNRYRDATIKWLLEQGIHFEHILMRPDDNYEPDHHMKIVLVEKFFGSKEEVLKCVLFAFDDRDSVVEAFRNYGIRTWQVAGGDF